MTTRFLRTFRGVAPSLSILLLLVALAPACGGKDEGGNLPKAVVRGDAPAAPEAPAAGQPAAAPVPPPETVIVRVNGEDITQGQIDEQIADSMKRMFGGMSISPDQIARMRPTLAERAEKLLVEQTLVAQEVAKQGVTVSDEEIAERWKQLDARLPEGMTREQALARSGLTPASAEREIRRGLEIEQLIQKHAAVAEVTDETVRKHYDTNVARFTTPEKVRARHILLKVDAKATPEEKAAVKTRLEEIRADLTKEGGKSFGDLAGEHSACPSGKQGGDLGLFGRGQMVPEFDKLAFTLEPGVVSEVFSTQFGYHILEVQEKHPAKTRPFEEVKDQIRKQLEQSGQQQAFNTYVAKLREAATISRPDAP